MKLPVSVVFLSCLLCCCSDRDDAVDMEIASLAFGPGETIPLRHTCDGDNISPPLYFSYPPDDAVSFAIVMEDIDAPEEIRTHWLLWNLPGTTRSVEQDAPKNRKPWPGVSQGLNYDDEPGYTGPCPVKGEEHKYLFRVYALDEMLDLDENASRSSVLSAAKERKIGYGELIGRYRR